MTDRKRKRAARHENHERWLVSYADFITLLFAFFVVMFATAQNDKSKVAMVAQSVREALGHEHIGSAFRGVLKPAPPATVQPTVKPPQNPPPTNQADLAKALHTLNTVLEDEVRKGKVSLSLDQRGLIVSLRELAFFASGDDALNPSSLPIVEKIAAVIATLPHPVRLEGHTDARPIHNSRFRSNWELSVARSITMLQILRDRGHLPAGRLSVAGFAENAPVDTNETEEGRMHNRRVDLVVLSDVALRGEPLAAEQKGPSLK